MAKKRRTRTAAAPAAAAASASILTALDADALVQVLRSAKAAGVLSSLASSSRQLCSLARSRVPVKLRVRTRAQAQLVLNLHARGGAPFSSCSHLSVKSADPTCDLLAVSVLGAAKHWTGLEQLELHVHLGVQASQPGDSVDCSTSAVLSALPDLQQQLRRLELSIPDLGTCSACHLGQLAQLTSLKLVVRYPAADVRPNVAAMAHLTNLVELKLDGAPAVQPAAAGTGTLCLPSSLTALTLHGPRRAAATAATMAGWVTHLQACPHLQCLRLWYVSQQHASAHPHSLVPMLAQHNQQLRSLSLSCGDDTEWDASVAGLPAAAGPVDKEWRPTAALAALTGLEDIDGSNHLSIKTSDDWQLLGQLKGLTRLSSVAFLFAPLPPAPPPQQQQLPGAMLVVLELIDCNLHLGGYHLGCLLLACPMLEYAEVSITPPLVPTPVWPAGTRLGPHSMLQRREMEECCSWGDAVAAVGHFEALAPVLEHVPHLALQWWPHSSSSQARGGLPDLSPCTALTSLTFGFPPSSGDDDDLPPSEQEDFLSMLAPLVQLRDLELRLVPRLNARVVLVLQSMLPQLRRVEMASCGELFPLASRGCEDLQQEEQALAKLKLLLRPGLVLDVCCV